MWAVLFSAITSGAAWLLRGVVIKLVVFSALLYWTGDVVKYLASKLPDYSASLSTALSGINPGIWWGLDLFAFNTGFGLILAAYLTRFFIRRIPFFN